MADSTELPLHSQLNKQPPSDQKIALFPSHDRQRAFEFMQTRTTDIGNEDEGLSAGDRKMAMVREIYEKDLLSENVLRSEWSAYPGSGLDVEFPLALGCRRIRMIDPLFEKGRGVEELIARIQRIREQNITTETNEEGFTSMRFAFDFGQGDEQVEIEIVPKKYNPKDPPPMIADPLPEEKKYRMPDRVGMILGFQSHFEQLTDVDAAKIVPGGVILNNQSFTLRCDVTLEDYERLDQEGTTLAFYRDKYEPQGFRVLELQNQGNSPVNYTFLQKAA